MKVANSGSKEPNLRRVKSEVSRMSDRAFEAYWHSLERRELVRNGREGSGSSVEGRHFVVRGVDVGNDQGKGQRVVGPGAQARRGGEKEGCSMVGRGVEKVVEGGAGEEVVGKLFEGSATKARCRPGVSGCPS